LKSSSQHIKKSDWIRGRFWSPGENCVRYVYTELKDDAEWKYIKKYTYTSKYIYFFRYLRSTIFIFYIMHI
jgi:hypothetical protein